MVRKLYALLTAILITGAAVAQVNSGTLKGKVSDSNTGETLPFVNVIVYLNGTQAAGGTTDFDGGYNIKPIDPGTYDVEFSFVGYQSKRINGVVVNSGKITFLDAKMSEGIELQAAEIVEYKVPLIDKDGGASGGTVTREDIGRMPGRSANAIATTVGGVSSAGNGDGSLSIRGARSSGTFYYIDGIKVRGGTQLPKSAIEEISVIQGGLPANYGDVTGGVISITTRGASSFYFGGVEMITSGFKIGDNVVGLDKFGYNLVEGVLSGPLLSRKNEDGTKGDPLLGFFLSANYLNQQDSRPTFGGTYSITEDARARILDNPLRLNVSDQGAINGTLYNTDFLAPSDFTRVATRQNDQDQRVSLATKIDVATSPTLDISFGGSGTYGNSMLWDRGRSLMNWENNVQRTELDWRVYGRLSQRFLQATDEETAAASNMKNIFYTDMLDYSTESEKEQDPTHEDRFFRYGHVGKYDVYRRYTYEQATNADGLPLNNEFIQNGIQDTLVTFSPSEFNPILGTIMDEFYDLFEIPSSNLDPNVIGLPDEGYQQFIDPLGDQAVSRSLNTLLGSGGVRNGDNPQDIYGLWTYPGVQANTFVRENFTQFRLTAAGSADIGDHALQIGLEYEQRKDSRFAAAPRAFWTIGRQLVNSHIQPNDTSSVQLVTNDGSNTYITYNPLVTIGDQSEFDRNVRTSLGLDPNGGDFINIDAINPDDLSIDMFSADELLNQGNGLVSYYGFDHTGKRLRGNKPTLEDFFSDQDDNGNLTRGIGAYEPIYIAGYVMDKFSFDDIIFNVGVRVDRFDANQPILKDNFVVGDALTAGEVNEVGGNSVSHPVNIGDDYVVYVDNVEDPSSIVGYRDGEIWYNSLGSVTDDPLSTLASSNSNLAPLLNGGFTDEVEASAFRDYIPQINVMPRISFSFPISDEAVFFAHYDVLTQRPTFANRFNPIDYLFLQTSNDRINNPSLRPTRTVDYELGFQQVLSRTSSLKISAFYRELKDNIQVRNFVGAYPNTYTAYGNLDFGTVKGMTAAYDLRRTGNIWMKVNYTLQFADGTGSNVESALALINAGLPNLRQVAPTDQDQRHRISATIDYRYGEGADYNGPVWFGKPVFQNTGVNFIGELASGTPYTASTIPVPITGGISPATEGSINGSRLPWNFTLNGQIDKNWTVSLRKGDEAAGIAPKSANLNVYLWVLNILNTRNIIDVYRFTGESDDDGYLAAARYQAEINSTISPDAFRNYYRMRVDDPFNLGQPRQIRLGIKFDF